MKKWIEVEGKMMDSVEFTRYIRRKTAPEIRRYTKKVIAEERKSTKRLRELQKTS